jgi:hypothetical protein
MIAPVFIMPILDQELTKQKGHFEVQGDKLPAFQNAPVTWVD